jgi:hypothetical protein
MASAYAGGPAGAVAPLEASGTAASGVKHILDTNPADWEVTQSRRLTKEKMLPMHPGLFIPPSRGE